MNKITKVLLACLAFFASCSVEDSRPAVFDLDYMAHIYPGNFVPIIDNRYMPLMPNARFTYTGQTADGTERTEIEVLADKRLVLGISCTVVWDRVFLDDELIEETYDWYAQDKDGNVWYFGEDVDNYIDGVIDNHFGAWEAGVDGAEPGVVMLGNPVVGLKYRQEHYEGQAEDHGEIVSNGESVAVAVGSFTGCLKIEETNPLDPSYLEYKYYASGVGLILVETIDVPVEREELESYMIN